mmetsp:Transcript_23112/g.20513  ORF Transcript_23112/g.20513 Transcript_23112/m.20513 type:complete len:83 (+) Transcript_23112:166-414(+)
MSVPNHQLNGTSFLTAEINDVTNTDGNTEALSDKLTIGISKGETRYNYPVNYIQDFNFKPYESYVQSNIFSCNDDLYNEEPD